MGANVSQRVATLESGQRLRVIDRSCAVTWATFCNTPWDSDWMAYDKYGRALSLQLVRLNAFEGARGVKIDKRRYAPADESVLLSWIRSRSNQANDRLVLQGALLKKDYGDVLQSLLFEAVRPLFVAEGYAVPSHTRYEHRNNTAQLMRGVGFVEWAQGQRIGTVFSNHNLADHGEAMLMFLAELALQGDANDAAALDVLYILACCLYCLALKRMRA